MKTDFTLDARFKSYGFSKFKIVLHCNDIIYFDFIWVSASFNHANINPRRTVFDKSLATIVTKGGAYRTREEHI